MYLICTLFVLILRHINFWIHQPHLPCWSLFFKYIAGTLFDILQFRKACPVLFWCLLATKNINDTFIWFSKTSKTINCSLLDAFESLKKSLVHCLLQFILKNNQSCFASYLLISKHICATQLLWSLILYTSAKPFLFVYKR